MPRRQGGNPPNCCLAYRREQLDATEKQLCSQLHCHCSGTLLLERAQEQVMGTRGGHAQLFFESAIAIPQLEGSTSSIAILQLLKKCCSATATPQSQFFLKSATSSPQLESFNSAIFGTFLAVESGRFMGKNSEVKNLMLLSL